MARKGIWDRGAACRVVGRLDLPRALDGGGERMRLGGGGLGGSRAGPVWAR